MMNFIRSRSAKLLSAVASLSFGLTAILAAPLEQKSPPTPAADAAHPLLVWDVAASALDGLPRSFRATSDAVKTNAGQSLDVTGLADLRASGSAAFTEANLKLILARLPGPVTVFDLRQEDHLYVNGQPISWYATNNWANVGRAHDAILAGEAARLRTLTPGSVLQLADAGASKGAAATAARSLVVDRAATEREVVTAAGASYVRLTVSDHARPLDEEVDRFLLAVRALPAGGWVHFHCRAGKGRTTTFIALYDMLRNANRAFSRGHRQPPVAAPGRLQPAGVGRTKRLEGGFGRGSRRLCARLFRLRAGQSRGPAAVMDGVAESPKRLIMYSS